MTSSVTVTPTPTPGRDERRIVVTRSVTVARPLGQVRDQVGDLVHHQRRSPHRGVRFEVVDDRAWSCTYRQITAVGPFRLTQVLELDRVATGPLVNRIVSGAFTGGAIRFAFASLDADTTRVDASIEVPLGRAARTVRPILERHLGATLDRALAEDRADLENGTFGGS